MSIVWPVRYSRAQSCIVDANGVALLGDAAALELVNTANLGHEVSKSKVPVLDGGYQPRPCRRCTTGRVDVGHSAECPVTIAEKRGTPPPPPPGRSGKT